MNLLTRFIENVERRPNHTAVHYFNKGHNYTLSWEQSFDFIQNYFQGLLQMGLEKGERVVIYSNTNKEWGFLDLAIMAAGGLTVPIYHSSPEEDVDYILNHSQPRFVIVENETLFNKLKKTDFYQNIKQVILMKDFDSKDKKCVTLKEIVSNDNDESFKKSAKKISLEDSATIIYTSGTSGTPKGALLTHQQVLSSVAEVFPLLGVTHNDRTLTFLPFSHVLGRMELWGSYFCGYTIGYAESIDRLKKNLPVVKPTVIVGVPRIFEKIYFGILAQIQLSQTKRKLFGKALEIGKKVAHYRRQRKSPPWSLAIKYKMAQKTIFKTIHDRLGGNLRFTVSGGAPLDPQIAQVFEACGIPILEGYGLTETTGPIFVNTIFEHQLGSVGKAIGEVRVRLDHDGEILVKSQKVMQEYFNDPESTKKVMTEDGYFRTGDIGELDPNGYLKITDRKKDLIKTAGGKFIAPQKLQNLFATTPLVEHIHIHGDKKKYVVALITLEKDQLQQLKKSKGLTESSFQDLSQHPEIEKSIKQSVAEVNQKLASFETIKRYKILDHEFTIEDGHLTPSLKMKRKRIDEIYQKDIDNLYL